jgi:hypothetical protein
MSIVQHSQKITHAIRITTPHRMVGESHIFDRPRATLTLQCGNGRHMARSRPLSLCHTTLY